MMRERIGAVRGRRRVVWSLSIATLSTADDEVNSWVVEHVGGQAELDVSASECFKI
jgi:hypothetical protein